MYDASIKEVQTPSLPPSLSMAVGGGAHPSLSGMALLPSLPNSSPRLLSRGSGGWRRRGRGGIAPPSPLLVDLAVTPFPPPSLLPPQRRGSGDGGLREGWTRLRRVMAAAARGWDRWARGWAS